MATWEDGPEYAPEERPAAFAEPAAGIGLEPAPPSPPEPVLPAQQPVFDGPAQPGPALASLVQEPPAVRDPRQPFDVASSVMTAESSAWASAHWAAPQPGARPAAPQAPITISPSLRPGTSPQPSVPGFPPPSGGPAYPPPPSPYATYPANQPFPPPGQPASQGAFPAPGTTQWFAPGSYPPSQPPPTVPDARTVLAAATPGVLVTLVVGGFIWILAPITLVLAFVLSRRMTYARKATQTAFAAVLAFVGLVGLVSIFTADGVFSDWWDNVAGWGCFGSWVMVVLALVLVYRAIKQGRPDPPPTPRAPLR